MPKPGLNSAAKYGRPGWTEKLPSRHAMSKLTGGSPAMRTMSNYAKLAPSGSGAPPRYSDIQKLGLPKLPKVPKF